MTNENQVSTQVAPREIVQTAEGKFKRLANYVTSTSFAPETKEEKIWLFNLLSTEDIATPMKDLPAKGTEVNLKHIITSPFESVDEETGEISTGVLTYLVDHENKAYVTSSKTVYWTLDKLQKVFGNAPYAGGELVVEIYKSKGINGDIINIRAIG